MKKILPIWYHSWWKDFYRYWYYRKGTRIGKKNSTNFGTILGTIRTEPKGVERFLPILVPQERNRNWLKDSYRYWYYSIGKEPELLGKNSTDFGTTERNQNWWKDFYRYWYYRKGTRIGKKILPILVPFLLL